MTDVWLVSRLYHFQGSEIVAVYDSEVKAKEAVALVDKASDTTVSYEKWEVK